MPLRVVFMGTPDFAVPTLETIARAGHDVAAVYTRAPAPAGRRGLTLQPSPVHALADHVGVPVRTPRSLRDAEVQAEFAAWAADVGVVVAYGLILPPPVLAAPRLGCLNLHGSLLPRWRGAAPMQRAIMAGDRETGVMVMRMEAGLDTGPVALTGRVPITPDMTAGDLHDQLAPLGAELMAEALDTLDQGALQFTPQPDVGVTYAQKIDKAECRIDWDRTAAAVHDHIRGLSPFPGAYFEADLGRGPERVKVLRSERATGAGLPGTVLSGPPGQIVVACLEGALSLMRLQRAGKPATDAASFLNGTPIRPGLRLSIP